jgi:hypothetical protein
VILLGEESPIFARRFNMLPLNRRRFHMTLLCDRLLL